MKSFIAKALAVTLALMSVEAQATELAFVSNEKDNTISVLDTGSLKVVKTIPVGKRPRGMVLTPDGKKLIVCAGDDNRLDVIDTTTLEIIKSYETSGPDPELLDIDPSGTTIYVANEDDGMVTVLDVAGEHKGEIQIGVEPEGMSVAPDNSVVVATSESTSMAHFINTQTLKVVANVLVDTRPRVSRFTADGREVWVTAEVGGTVSIIDAITQKTKKKIAFQISGVRPELIQPMGVVFTKDGKRAAVALGRANRIAIIDTATYEVQDYVLVGQRPWHMALNADGSKLYTANGLSNDATVVDTATWKPEKSVSVGRLPWGIVIKP
ncbi:MAG: PQQ-dependent catabolism-associated beta-propeller protein [Hyphomicrobium sp.]|jgi:PQQ-dependent catabolism-associated beta-propeller protein